MMNTKVLGFAGFVTTFGLAALVGCGGGGDPAPSLALTNANSTMVASRVLVDSNQVTNFEPPTIDTSGGSKAFAPLATRGLRAAVSRFADARRTSNAPGANATQTQACDGGGSVVIDSNAAPGATTGTGTLTFSACVQGGVTLDGKVSETVSGNNSALTFSASLNLTITAGDLKVVEAGDISVTADFAGGSGHISSNQISVAVTSPTVNEKITMSNLDLASSASDGGTSVTESFSVETKQLGGLVSVDTDAAVQTASLAVHPHAGQVTVTGAKNSKLVITILGDESFTPPAGQGQVKLELDSGDGKLAAAVYASWADIEAASAGITTNGF